MFRFLFVLSSGSMFIKWSCLNTFYNKYDSNNIQSSATLKLQLINYYLKITTGRHVSAHQRVIFRLKKLKDIYNQVLNVMWPAHYEIPCGFTLILPG
jgi:hypothetical protein